MLISALSLESSVKEKTGRTLLKPSFLLYSLVLASAVLFLPSINMAIQRDILFLNGGLLALWRYGWGTVHFMRSLMYRKIVFPRWRRLAKKGGKALMPSQIYLLFTSYRIEANTTQRVVHAAVQEAIRCGVPVKIMACVIELADEFLYRKIFDQYKPPPHVQLHIVRMHAHGKRETLAHGFRAISRDMPPSDAVVAVMDGDTLLSPGALRKCAPFFKIMPRLGGLTTDEMCELQGSNVMRSWQNMRFAQRHIMMGSLALSRRVMTLTGRMSMYRAKIICDPDFINTMLNDCIDHWRFGRIKFLTGDDKTSLFWLLKNGYEQIYVPDCLVWTIEDMPGKNFVHASGRLMFRWFGNMLRTNIKVLRLGPRAMPFFVWWCFLDQRISMWTSLAGPVFAIMLTLQYGGAVLLYYLAWVAFTRWIVTLSILSARKEVNGLYPLLLYYNQTFGSLIKTYVLFRLNRQVWTRQGIVSGKSTGSMQDWMDSFIHATAFCVFVCVLGLWSGIFHI